MTKQTILSIITFTAIAFGLTFAFSKIPAISFYSVDIKEIICGFLPLINVLICYKFFATPTTYSISGTQPLKVWLIVFIAATTLLPTNTRKSFEFNFIFLIT